MRALFLRYGPLQVALLIVVFLILYFTIPTEDGNYLWRLPHLIAWLPQWINDSVDYLMFQWLPIEIYDPEIDDYEASPLLKEVTRAFSTSLLFSIDVLREFLLGGVKTIAAFTGWDYARAHPDLVWPALPWTIVAAGAALLGYALKGRWLAAFAAFALVYIAAFGQWEPAMETVSLVLIAAPISFVLGLLLGVMAFRSRAVEAVLTPLLNVAQTMPHFSYLVPVMVMFGVGDHAGAIATIIFATPPMVRLTLLGLKRVPLEVVEAALMSGCTNRQLMFKVMIPAARRDILIGVNQVIMQCLALAVIASFIGAKGLGFNLLLALNQLRIGQALELGVCIVLIAVLLDRLSLAWANKKTDYFADQSFTVRHKFGLVFSGIFVGGIILAYFGSIIFADSINYFYLIPHNKGITTENFWQSGVDWMVENWYQGLQGFNRWLITQVLIPMKTAFLGMPVFATFVLTMGIGFIVGGVRSMLTVGLLLLFIALTEWWDRALITAYMTTFAVIVAAVIGFSVGVLAAQSDRASRIVLLLCDTFQTFPSFIYLIPVIMLFGVTDTSVLLAVIVYATIPATRYTVEGLRSVPPALRDLGLMSGANWFQRFASIELPLALPHIMLGINQTVIFALFMVIIGAMIGTDDLGQYILKALSDKNGIGNGLMLGLCVAFMGLAVDHVIQTWARKQRKLLGLA
jgi:glycine betaine/proline transport system permease protein